MKHAERQLQGEYENNKEIIREFLSPSPTVVAIEGGPCAGKTTAVEKLRSMTGRTVVVLPEAATDHIAELMKVGVSPADLEQGDRPAYLEFETKVLETIMRNIEDALDLYRGTDAIIVTDRCDIGAYVSEDEYDTILRGLGLDMPPLLSHVDKVYYLQSLAHIDASKYDELRATNPSRQETAAEAKQVCDRTLRAVSRHPELTYVSGECFDQKIERLIESVMNPEVESEVKLLPRRGTPDIAYYLSLNETLVLAEHIIEQSYHVSNELEFRLRKTITEKNETVYTLTVKNGQGVTRHEHQRRISEAYYRQLQKCPQVGGSVLKNRTSILVGDDNQLWTLDYHLDRRLPEWNVEVAVRSDQHARHIETQTFQYFERASQSARSLALLLGNRALRPQMLVW